MGVQYGLSALEAGAITAGAVRRPQREASAATTRPARRSPARTDGRPEGARRRLRRRPASTAAGWGCATTPIIDQRTYLDRAGLVGDIHTAEMSFIMRERLIEANGTAANQVIIESRDRTAGRRGGGLRAGRDGPLAHRDRRRPLAPRPGGEGRREQARRPRRRLLPARRRAHPRAADLPAGRPVRRAVPGRRRTRGSWPARSCRCDVLKCRLAPIDFRDYPVPFTDAQRARLRAAFPGGVCDYSRPGVGQQRPRGTWLAVLGFGTQRRRALVAGWVPRWAAGWSSAAGAGRRGSA